jgi:LEA14-like dessication related protein
LLSKKKPTRTRKLLRIAVIIMLVTMLAIVAIHVHYSNALSSALVTSFGTFRVASVTYPTVTADLVELNITLTLDNPSEFPITAEAIALSFFVDEESIGNIAIPLEEVIPAANAHYFHSVQNITDADVLASLRKSTYVLKISGEISGAASFLFVQAEANKRLNLSKLVEGVAEPSLK